MHFSESFFVGQSPVLRRCWECPHGACQHLASWAAQKDVRVEQEQGRKDEAFKLLGQQQLLISQHWDVSTNTLIKSSAELKDENQSLVGQKKAKDFEN